MSQNLDATLSRYWAEAWSACQTPTLRKNSRWVT
jgi:hypothetical protein